MSDATHVADEELPDLLLPDGVEFTPEPTSSDDEPAPEPEPEPEAPQAEAEPDPEPEATEQSDAEDEFWRVQYKHNREEKVLDLREKLKDPAQRQEFIDRWQKAEDYDRVRQQRDAERAAHEEAQRAQRDHLVKLGMLKQDPTTGQYSYAQPQADKPKDDPAKTRLAELEGKFAAYEAKGVGMPMNEWREFKELDRQRVIAEAKSHAEGLFQQEQQRQRREAHDKRIQGQIQSTISSALNSHKDVFAATGEQSEFFKSQAVQAALQAGAQAGDKATLALFESSISQFATALKKATLAAQVAAAEKAKSVPRKTAPPVVTGGSSPAGKGFDPATATDQELQAAINASLREALG